MSIIICPNCQKKLGRVYHYGKQCNPTGLSKEEIKIITLKYNFPSIFSDHGKSIKDLYINKDYSVKELSDHYGLPYGKIVNFLKILDIPIKGLKESANSPRTREKYKETCKEKFGAENALSKNTTIYHKRNCTVKNKYGVDNIFQLETIKDQINKTMIEKYGSLRLHNPEKQKETKSLWSEEFKQKYIQKLKDSWNEKTDEDIYRMIQKKIQTMKLNQSFDSLTKMNQIESRISDILIKLNLPFTFSFFIKKHQYDFIIQNTNILLEIQGDFWHANPKFYKENDKIKMPGKGNILVESIWKKDIKKKQYAENHGYQVLYVWENDIREMSDDQLINHLNDTISQHIHHQ